MTPLRQRMLDCMLQRGFAQRTQGSYVEAISRMARHYRSDPAQLTAEQVSAYLLHMVKEHQLSFSTVNQAASACRFLYERVLGRSSEGLRPPMARVPQKQPHLLAREEIARLFSCCAKKIGSPISRPVK
jgi:integrase/recombinase XerD